MKRWIVLCAVLVLAGCDDGPRVVVHASLDGEPIADLPVRLLPYDRAALLDSLAAEAAGAGMPEPAVPQELVRALEAGERGSLALPADSARPDTSAATDTVSAADAVRTRPSPRALADSLRAARRAWADAVYAPADSLAAAYSERTGRGEQTDTTDASGRAVLSAEPGRWWVWARYRLPYSELRWSVPVDVTGDSAVVRLERNDARERPAL